MLKYLQLTFWGVMFLMSQAFAHPDVEADVVVEAVFAQEGFVGVRNHWTFDREFSASKLIVADKDRNGKISKQEGEILKNEILNSLKASNYHIYVLSRAEF